MNRIINSSVSRAVYDGNVDALSYLISDGSRIDIQDNLGWTPLHAAVSENRVDMVQILASQTEAPLNIRCYEGQTPLFLACLKKCDPNIISALLVFGADPNVGNNEHVFPLHVTQNTQVAEELITYGANVDVQDFNKYTPLHCAVEHKNLDLVEVLLTAGADAGLTECNGLTPFMLAFQNNFDCLERLLDATEAINTVADDGWTSLMLAINAGRINIAFELLNRGAEVNVVAEGVTALHLAVMRQELELFNRIWDKINVRLIRQAYSLPHLMLIHRWYVPERLQNFLQVLDLPELYTMQDRQNFLGFLFRFELDNKLEVAICEIVDRTLKANPKVDSIELISFIQNYSNFKYKFYLFDLLLTRSSDFDQKSVVLIATEFDPDFVPKLLTLSINISLDEVFRFILSISRNDFQILKLVCFLLNFYTPVNLQRSLYLSKLKDQDVYNLQNISYVLRGLPAERRLEYNKVIHYTISKEEKEVMCTLYDKICDRLAVNAPPSLKELSRDSVRTCLRRSCKTMKNCESVLCRLSLPKQIIDIIKLKQPVNCYL